MFKDLNLIYFDAATSELTNLGTIWYDFETVKEVEVFIADFAKDFFKNRPDEDPESEIYAENQQFKITTLKAKKYFCPCTEEPFDCDKEKDVDFNGDWN